MKTKHVSRRHSATSTGVATNYVTITHPHHPLTGRKLELLRAQRGRNSRLVVQLPDGSSRQIRRDWTDYHVSSDDPKHPVPSHLYTVEGLRQMITMLESQKQLADRE